MRQSKLGLKKHLEDLLSGRVAPKDADPRILNWAEFFIWQGACEIISLPSLEDRRAALDKIPETIRPIMEREVKKLWTARRKPDNT